MRKFQQCVWLFRKRSLILPCPVPPMDLRVIQCWFRQGRAGRNRCKPFLILLEQGGDYREQLSGNSTNDAFLANSISCSLIITARHRN